ncbi:MAG: hypothetical protein AAF694_19595 [Bacteroidota bacterium]
MEDCEPALKAYRGNAGPTLNPAQAQRLIAPHFPDTVRIDNDFEKYNSGLFIEIEGPENVGHTGGDPGVATLAFFDPATDVGMILFFNRKPTKRVAPLLGKTVRTIKYFASKF